MARLPDVMLPHTALVETLAGHAATGPVFAPAVSVPCLVKDARREARTAEGRTVTVTADVIAQLDTATTWAPGSRVTCQGRVTYVVDCVGFDPGTGPLAAVLPAHVEVTLA